MQQQIFHRSCYQQTCQTADRRCGPMVSYSLNKPLSIAVDEVYKGKVTIIPDTEDVEEAEAEAALEKNWKRKTKRRRIIRSIRGDAA